MRLRKLLEDGDIGQEQVTKFYASARCFYVQAISYSLTNLPLSDDMLTNASFVSFKKRESAKFSQVEYFVGR